MKKLYSIEIKGLGNPKEFVKEWSQVDEYPNDRIYSDFINKVLDDHDSFRKLFLWKNGTGEKLSGDKEILVNKFWEQKKVMISLKNDFSWERFESAFNPTTSATIWKIFLLHLINPVEFPIFDQHVHRFFRFTMDGEIIKDTPTNRKITYTVYKSEYRNWFNDLQVKFKLDHKKMDRAFWSFGKLLKNLVEKPMEIKNSISTSQVN